MVARQALIRQALQWQQQGQWQAAIAAYHQCLTLTPDDGELLYLLSMALLQSGQHQAGMHQLQQLLARWPLHAAGWNALGNAHRMLAQLEQGLGCYLQALALQPDDAAAQANLRTLERVLEQRPVPDDLKSLAPGPARARAYGQLADSLLLRQPELALGWYQRALHHDPSAVGLWFNRALALQAMGRVAAALVSIEQALALQPRLADAHYNRANLLKELGRYDEAIVAYQAALALRPTALAYNNLGNTFKQQQRYPAALAAYRGALALDAEYVDGWLNLANVQKETGQLEAALASYGRALQLAPEQADVHWNLALCLLLKGDYKAGWAAYEWRLQTPAFRADFRHYPVPAWRGQGDLRGVRLLVQSEQGLGDTVQFCRYLALLHERGAQLLVEVAPTLKRLLGSLKLPLTLLEKGQPLPPFDAYVPLLSLPYACATTLDTIPAQLPYLYADAGLQCQWQQRLGPREHRLRVGLVWRGSAAHGNDSQRSLDVRELLDLQTLAGVEWHCLQQEVRPEEQAILVDWPTLQLHTQALGDMADTAALINQLDLVISVDTSVAHLTGALGKPLWLMLAYAPDFRWMLERSDTPWYPGARLFRQPQPADWQPVVAAIRCQLQQLLA